MVWLLNWLWQGSMLTAAVAVGLAVTRRLNAATRERILWLTLAAVLVLPCAALLQDGSSPGAAAGPIAASLISMSPLIELPAELFVWTATAWSIWCVWSAVVLVRLMRALLELRRIRQHVSPFPEARERRLTRWMSLDHDGSKPRLVVSRDVHHAAVIGGRNPLIAISPASLAALTDDELDQVVVHEHAHVRRRDYVAVVAQRIAWALAGFHPAVWWLDRALTLEREVACDDWVLAHATAPTAYGACLVKLVEARTPARWQPAPGAASSRSELSQRVTRLLDPVRNRTVDRSTTALSLAAVAICCATVAGLQFPIAGQTRASAILDFISLPAASRIETRATATNVADAKVSSESTGVNAVSHEREIAIGNGVSPEMFPLERPSPTDTISTSSLSQELALPAGLETLEALALLQVAPPGIRATEPPAADTRSPWMRMADAGMAIGDGARAAGVRTGGLFSRLGRSVGSAF